MERPVFRRILFAFVAAILSCAVALTMAEITLRLVIPPPSNATADPLLGLRGVPGGDHDSRGYRNPVALTEADIVVLGDSQTYGYNATRNDAWPEVLSSLTGRSVYQMAYGGWNASQYDALLDDALVLKPKDVLVALYTGNDMLEVVDNVYGNDHWTAYRSSSYKSTRAMQQTLDVRMAIDSGADPRSLRFAQYAVRTWMRAHLRVYALLGDGTRGMREMLNLAEKSSDRSVRIDSFVASRPDIAYQFPDEKITTTLSPSYRFQPVNLKDPGTAEGWRITQALLLDIKERVPVSTRLHLVIIPTKEMVYLELMRRRGESIPDTFKTYDDAERDLLGTIRDFCRTQELDCISTLNALTDTLAGGQRIYSDDINGHPIAAGYYAIATTIKSALK